MRDADDVLAGTRHGLHLQAGRALDEIRRPSASRRRAPIPPADFLNLRFSSSRLFNGRASDKRAVLAMLF